MILLVIVQLDGGLGNQLFQYAVARCVAYKLNTELKLQITKFKQQGHGHDYYRLYDFNIQENFATPEEVARIKATGVSAPPFQNIGDGSKDVFISGHAFHSEEAFSDVADIIRREFTLKNPLHRTAAAWQKKILAAECSVALHIRHGDYLSTNLIRVAGALPLAYYEACITELKKSFENITVFVFSMDLNWARKNLKLDVPMEFVDECQTDNEEFYLMSLCKHTITANSTFSWWAGWLNPNPDKKVFAPYPWSRSGMWGIGMYPYWTRIPVDFEDLPVECPPLLSIIVHVRNNAENLPWLVSSILNQTSKDYELILIDDGSTDGSEHICRQASLNKKVTLIASGGGGIGQASAWNRGLDYARGKYVMFLSGNDLIFPDTVRMLVIMYSIQRADVISSAHRLIENPEGNVVIGGLKDKKFVHVIDEQFKTLRAPTYFVSNDMNQKLLMIGSQAFNTLMSTKFFRRDFLKKNALRFNENLSTDAALPFIANAFLFSEGILITPDLFYIAPPT